MAIQTNTYPPYTCVLAAFSAAEHPPLVC